MSLMMGSTEADKVPQSLDELASRMVAYRERAAAARHLAQAISDKQATAGLIKDAEEFERKAEAIATQIVQFAHDHHRDEC